MFCPNCGTKNNDGDIFCAQCGAPLQEVEAPEEQELQDFDIPQEQSGMENQNWQDQPGMENQNWQDQPGMENQNWQDQPGMENQYWQDQTQAGNQNWQEQPYEEPAWQGQPGGAPVAKQKKPVPKLLILLIIEAVALIGLAIGVVKVVGDRFSPETVALNYWKAAANHEWGKAYDYCSFPDSKFLSRQMYVDANADNDELTDYESVKIHDVADEVGEESLDDLGFLLGDDSSDTAKELKSSNTKYYVIEYLPKGEDVESYSYVAVEKTKGKNFLFWDKWKVTSSDSWITDVQFTVPENAQVSLNGEKVDDSDASVEDGMKTITIPYMFVGEYQMTVSEEGMEEYRTMLQVSSSGAQEDYIELAPSQETIEEVAAQAGDDIQTIVESALSGKDFSEIESLFTEEALSERDIQEDYKDLVEELKGDGSTTGIISLQLSNAKVELDYASGSGNIDFYITMDKKETYYRSWSDTPGESDYPLTAYSYYQKEDGEWKLNNLPITQYDF